MPPLVAPAAGRKRQQGRRGDVGVLLLPLSDFVAGSRLGSTTTTTPRARPTATPLRDDDGVDTLKRSGGRDEKAGSSFSLRLGSGSGDPSCSFR
jgi:hypothetical protein